MAPHKGVPSRESRSVLQDRHFVTCRECGWVHYAMTPEEKALNDRLIERYQLTKAEQQIYESAFRQCLRCETAASEFRAANEQDLDRAEGHRVTPVLIEVIVKTH